RSHDVVAEHRLHIVPGGVHLRGHVGRAVQALLFSGDGGEHQCAGELVGGEHAVELEHEGDTGGIVIGTRRVAGEIQDVGDPGVQVPGDDVEPPGGRAALNRGVDV